MTFLPKTLSLVTLSLATLSLGSAFGTEEAEPTPTLSGYTETVTVTDTRLSDQPAPASTVPASTTVLTRRDIAASGARTLQELLARIAGVIVFDEIGNGIQSTLDLRGFTGGGVTVLLDGARLNDPRNNVVPLESIGLDAIERIEVTRGAAAATVGGGSASGVIQITTRKGAGPITGAVGGSFGSFGSNGASLEIAGGSAGSNGPAGPAGHGLDGFLSLQHDATDGFRDNADARLHRFGSSLGYTFGKGSRLWLALHAADDTIGAPGALTLDEFDADPEQAPYNQLDDSDLSYRQGVLGWSGPLGGDVSLAAQISYLRRDTESLTTGRSAAAFGGFDLDAQVRTFGSAVQATAPGHIGSLAHTFVAGAEMQDGINEAEACGTLTSDLEACDPASFFASKNRTDREDLAFFAQDSLEVGSGVSVLVGGRWDRARMTYDETRPDPTNAQERTYEETSWKGGVAWNPSGEVGLYANYGEAFQPPTVEDLFAFPGFGSNPDLDPVRTKSYELGVRGTIPSRSPSGALASRGPLFEYAVSVYRANLTNEIIFTPQPTPSDPFAGLNENVGRSRREGIEATLGWRPTTHLAFSAVLAEMRARFICTDDDPPGSPRCEGSSGSGSSEVTNDVPLVPGHRIGVSGYADFGSGLALRVDLLDVGSQVLANDDAGNQSRLDGYQTVDARLTWRRGGADDEKIGGFLRWFELYLEGRNLLDEEYATRGIYAFDFSTFASTTFVTPAPPRTVRAGARLAF